jgi:hypothetical protein
VKITFFACNSADNDQRFRIVNIQSQAYTTPLAANSVGVLEAATGYRVTLPANNSTPGLNTPNDNDLSQKIQFLRVGTNQYLFQRANTNYSLSSNTLDYVTANTSGMSATTYNSGEGRWQNFGLVDVGGGWHSIKYAWNPNFCLSAGIPTNTGVTSIVPCNTSDNRQRFRFDNFTSAVESTRYNYAVLASNGSGTSSSGGTLFTGHTWSAVYKLTKFVKKYYKNGVYQSSDSPYYSGNLLTLSSWLNKSSVPVINGAEDTTFANRFFDSILDSGWTYRLKSLSDADYDSAITSKMSQTGCTQYVVNLFLPSLEDLSTQCGCTRASLRYWKLVTGETIYPGLIANPTTLQTELKRLQNNASAVFIRP